MFGTGGFSVGMFQLVGAVLVVVELVLVVEFVGRPFLVVVVLR